MNHLRGLLATRCAKAFAVANGDTEGAIAYVQGQNWRNEGDVVEACKASVTAIGTDDIVPPTPSSFDYAEFIRPLTIVGRLAVRRAPFRLRMISATSGATAYWAGERNTRPISRLVFEAEALEQRSVVAIAVTSQDLVRSSNPYAETLLSRDLSAAGIAALDASFIDPSNAGVAGVMPAAISYGVTPRVSTGSTVAAIDNDLGAMIDDLSAAGSDLASATWVLHPRTATWLSRLRGTDGALAYPGMGAKGGVLLGLPAITSAGVPIGTTSPGFNETSITLLDASQVLVADEGAGDLQASRQGAVFMDSAPPGGPQQLLSLFQVEAVAFKIVRYLNWRRCRDDMAQVLVNVAY